MTENMGKRPSGHRKTEIFRPSVGCGENYIPSTVVRKYDQAWSSPEKCRFIWEIPVKNIPEVISECSDPTAS